ncbi:hypothetical protein ACHHYP_02480 [Achlya hypogyna]|uniref:Uncharacterized protein n=1 Tax=Achlya hypogyna TaxID=1202772 RepID=A0A1V9Z697_ACHHY|nr:hypothetical protein ACHHYP_02480 [Achlya hypogyna]
MPMVPGGNGDRFLNLVYGARHRYRKAMPTTDETAAWAAARARAEAFGWLDAMPLWSTAPGRHNEVLAVVKMIQAFKDPRLEKTYAWYHAELHTAITKARSGHEGPNAKLPGVFLAREAVRYLAFSIYRSAIIALLDETHEDGRRPELWDELVFNRLQALYEPKRDIFPTLAAVSFARVRWEQRRRLRQYIAEPHMTPYLLLLLLRHDFYSTEPPVTIEFIVAEWPEIEGTFKRRHIRLQ